MIDFNNVLITDKNLYIDVSIKDSPYFENCYIDRIVVNDISTFSTAGPNVDKCVYDTNDHAGDIEENAKSVELFIKENVILNSASKPKDTRRNIYFIYVHTVYNVPSDSKYLNPPCGSDCEWHSIAVIDYQYIYNRALSFIRELVDCKCSRPEKLVDFILHTKALEMFLESKRWDLAIEYFNKNYLFDDGCNNSSALINKSCGCCNG